MVSSNHSHHSSGTGFDFWFGPSQSSSDEMSGLIPAGQLQALSPGALAYLGDAVFELFVRSALLLPPRRIHSYHKQVVEQVRAERQAQHLEALVPRLTQEELDIVKRGRNASPRGPRRLRPAVYQQATSFETLIGHLYLSAPTRLSELLGYIDLTSPQK